jgi:endoglucanase
MRRLSNLALDGWGDGLMARTTLVLAAILVATAIVAGPSSAEENEAAAVCAAVDSSDVAVYRLKRLARGYNLTGWLDRNPSRVPDETLLASLNSKGFNHVRLPIDGEALMPMFAAPDVRHDKLVALDRAVTKLLGFGYAVIIDMHPGARFSALHRHSPDDGYRQLEIAWRDIATLFADRAPDQIFFELLNEPRIRQSVWERQARQLAAAMRRVAPDHTLIYGTANAQDIHTLTSSSPLEIPNVVYAVHFYDPMVFTHQGLEWGGETPLRYLKHVPFPLRQSNRQAEEIVEALTFQRRDKAAALLHDALAQGWDDQQVAQAFVPLAQWALRYRKPIIVDEFGVLRLHVNLEDRSRWLRAVRVAAEKYCFGWTHWEFAEGFGFLNESGTAIEPKIAAALLGGG